MNDEADKLTPKTSITPLSVASIGSINAMVMRKTITHPDGRAESDIYVNIRRMPVKPSEEPNLIPLIELPALVMLLKAIAEPAMSVRPISPPTPPAPPAPSPTPPKRPATKKATKPKKKSR